MAVLKTNTLKAVFADRLSRLFAPMIDRGRERFDQLSIKDQRAVTWLTVFMAVLLFWLMLWKPLDEWADTEYSALVMERETQEFLAANYQRAREIVQSQKSGPKKDAAAVISTSARQMGLELSRVQPARQGVSVWADALPYQRLLSWLVQLHNREGIEVRQIRIDRTDQEGMVKVFMRLSR